MSQQRQPSRTRSPQPLSRPTTPLRPSSRSSFRNSQSHQSQPTSGPSALDALEPQFAELSDSMADLEANFMHLQLMNESLQRFSESFAAFLYGLEMRAFVVDFPEAPMPESIKRWQKIQRRKEGVEASTVMEKGDETTVDTSYASLKATPRRKSAFGGQPVTPGTVSTSKSSNIPSTRGGGVGRGGRGQANIGRARASGLPRGRGRGGRG